jgi:hypothetical protein
MGLTVCPVAIVAAPVEVVRANLTEWERFSEWAGVPVERVEPEGSAAAGQTVHFTGMGVRFTFKVEASIPPDTSSTCMFSSPWDYERNHVSPARELTRPAAAFNTSATSSSQQAGGAGSSKNLGQKPSPPA